MKKIISLFKRNFDGPQKGLVRDEVTEGAEWVAAGEGRATRKFDGTCCKVEDGKLWKRYDRKLTKQAHRRKKQGFNGPWQTNDYKPAPECWIEAEAAPDLLSGHWPGWMPVGDGPEDKWHREAFASCVDTPIDGTYELCGPKIHKDNPEHYDQHELIPHGAFELIGVPHTFMNLRNYFDEVAVDIEGVVWHHPDGRMVKIKASDFGLTRKPGV